MAIITLGELLHRKAGGAISAQNPLQVRQFDGSGNAISPATETTLGAVKTAVESLAQEDFATQATLAELKTEIDKLTALISDGALKTALSGQIVENVNGALAIRTKQVSLAYQSWDFDGQDNILITAGSSLREMTSHQVNGFSTLAWIVRVNNVLPDGPARSDHSIRVRVRWQSTPGAIDFTRSVWQELFHDETSDYSASGLTDTRGQYVFLELTNEDTVDHMYHIHAMLRI